MSNKEFQEMIKLFLRLKSLIKKYEGFFDDTSLKSPECEPIMIPPDVYDDI